MSLWGEVIFREKMTGEEHEKVKSLVKKFFNLLDIWDGCLEAFFTEGIKKPYWRRCQFKIRKEKSVKQISVDTYLFLRRHVQAPITQYWVLVYKNHSGSGFQLSNASSSLFSELLEFWLIPCYSGGERPSSF